MALDDMFQGGIDAAVQNRSQLEPVAPRQEPGFSFWGATTAPFKGMAAGGVESAAFWSETAGAFGDVQASYNYSGMMPVGVQTESEWRPEDAKEARERLLSGESFSNPIGDSLRETSRWIGPDQQTAGAAEQTLFQLSRVITKAVGYSVAGGIVPGAVATGLDEGVTTSDELRREGVDFETRTKVGGIAGVSTAVGVALPVAGVGIKSTAALIASGGPGLFVAQNYLTRDILQSANYDTLADRYDPFDPVGLAVSTLLPTAFGGWAMRGRAKAARAQEAANQPLPEPWRNQPHNSELVDVARVQRSKEIVDSWNLGKPEDIRAANDALLSVMRASDQLADGLPVHITDHIPMEKAYTARAIERMIERAEVARAEMLPDAAMIAEPGAVSTLRADIKAIESQSPALSDTAIRTLAKEIQSNTPHTSYKQALSQARDQLQTQADEAKARIARLEEQIEANTSAADSQRALATLDAQIQQMKKDRAAIDAPATALTPLSAAMREAGLQRRGPADVPPRTAKPQAAPEQTGIPQATNVPADVPASGARPSPSMQPVRVPEAAMQRASDQAVASRLAALQSTRADAMIRLESLTEDLPLTEALARIDAEAKQGIRDADLLRVAANCAIGA